MSWTARPACSHENGKDLTQGMLLGARAMLAFALHHNSVPIVSQRDFKTLSAIRGKRFIEALAQVQQPTCG
jgi:hypothetical protein